MRVLLTRPHDHGMALERALRAFGHSVHLASMFRTCPVSHDRRKLAGAEAIVITSASAVQELGPLVGGGRKFFALGPDMARALMIAGARKVSYAEGTSESLLGLLLREWQPADGAIAYASGRHVSVDIARLLLDQGYDAVRIPVYDAEPVSEFDASARRLLEGRSLDAALFMSVRTAQTFVSLVNGSDLSRACRPLIAISPSRKIDDALSVLPWKQSLVADAPGKTRIDALLRLLSGPAEQEQGIHSLLDQRA